MYFDSKTKTFGLLPAASYVGPSYELAETDGPVPYSYKEYDGDWGLDGDEPLLSLTEEDAAPMPGAQVFVAPPMPAWDENDDLPF